MNGVKEIFENKMKQNKNNEIMRKYRIYFFHFKISFQEN